MNYSPPEQSFVRSPRLFFTLALCLLTAPLVLKAAAPGWWMDRGVVDPTQSPNDYAAVNQGQLKNIATRAAAELDANLPGGAGDDVNSFVAKWSNSTTESNDFAPVNLGMLKTVAKHFYDRLIVVGYTNAYPWNADQSTVNNYAAANIGQVKNLFSFDVTYDGNGDGLPDWWENHWFPGQTVNPAALAPRGDGLTVLQAFQRGLDPINYYGGISPVISIVSGNPQTGIPNSLAALPLTVLVLDAKGQPLQQAPVQFKVTAGGGLVQTSVQPPSLMAVNVRTDSTGKARAFFLLPPDGFSQSMITAYAGGDDSPLNVIFNVWSQSTYNSCPPTKSVAYLNADGSEDISWQNNDNGLFPVTIYRQQADGGWLPLITLPAGTTSHHFTAP